MLFLSFFPIYTLIGGFDFNAFWLVRLVKLIKHFLEHSRISVMTGEEQINYFTVKKSRRLI